MIDGKPNDDLVAELREVGKASASLQRSMQAHNFLPQDFPVEVVSLECEALKQLHLGSISGAQIIIEHALVRMSDVRRTFFRHEDLEDDLAENEEVEAELPVLERGDALDREFSFMLSSLSTALDAVRSQLQQEFHSTVTEEYFELARGEDIRSERGNPLSNADELQALSLAAQADEYRSSGEVGALSRATMDSRNAIFATQVETSSRIVITRWVKRLANFTAGTLRVLRLAIGVVQGAAGVAFEFYQKFQASVDRVKGVVIDELNDWLNDVSSRLSTTEQRLRDFAQSENKRESGVCRKLHSQLLIIGQDSSPFAIEEDSAFRPLPDTIVSFRKVLREDKIFASDIRIDSQSIFINGKFYRGKAAQVELRALIDNIFSVKRAVRSKSLEIALMSFSIAPRKFWATLGYDNFDDWMATLEHILFVGGGGRRSSYYTSKSLAIEDIDLISFRDWAFDYVHEKGGRARLDEVAVEGRHTFSKVSGLPVRVLLKKAKFGDVFEGDKRFSINADVISISSRINI